MSGRGPSITIKIHSIGNIDTDLKSEFIAKGINQTLHRVYLEVKCNIIIVTPFNDIEKDITNQILFAEYVLLLLRKTLLPFYNYSTVSFTIKYIIIVI